jgi:hypothetical protein
MPPRELDARAWLPLRDPPKALELLPRLGDTFRFPTLFELLPPRSKLPEPLLPPEPPRSKLPVEGRLPEPPRLPPCPWRDLACACRVCAESPRAPPPYLLAVARSLYGAPPRCLALCCQLLFPERLTLFCLLWWLT